MAGSLSYSDAVKLLGGDGKAVAALDNLAGGALLAATAGGGNLILNLFDAKGELGRLSGELVSGLSDKVSGLGRFGRTRRLEAAHTVIVLSAYFEAVAEAGLPDLHLRRSEQVAIAGGGTPGSDRLRHVTRELLHLDVPSISPHRPYEVSVRRLTNYYQALSAELCDFMTGLAVWDALDETGRSHFELVLNRDVPQAATRRYEELLRRLAADFPEVSFWVNLTDHQATRSELRSGLAELERILTGLAARRLPDDRRDGLARRYRAELGRGVVRTGDVPDGLRIPSLGDAYIDHRFRVTDLGRSSTPDREDWWNDRPVRDDLYGYLLGHLTSPEAVERPLLLLGQPGSGKSVLTKILSARLPASDFLVIRVVLRETPADADLQGQIEYAVRDATGETLNWPSLARTADGALPVVLLDGFDELLQATGMSQSDYLEQIVRFQEREADQGRPVVVVVTSRTAVADRARIPAQGAVAVRLEPFDDAQVQQWLDVWNRTNAAYLAGNGLRSLPAETALAHPELAGQPLLLMMLALYDADGNALQREGENLDRAGLYERLLTRFAEREVAKSDTRLDERDFRRAVEEDLLRLSLAAFAMFNRGRQWVTEEELDADLAALLGDGDAPAGVPAPLTAAQTAVGRFFFVHQAQAVRDQNRLTTCEFLHATFGEYLVARLVVRELAELARDAERNAQRARQMAADDGFLYALLSFMPLSIRRPTMDFLKTLLRGRPDRGPVGEMLLGLFRTAMHPRDKSGYTEYAPAYLPVPGRHAAYSANLLLLAAAARGSITASELFPTSGNVITDWRRHAMLWRSQLTVEGFFGLAGTLGLQRFWHENKTRDIALSLDHTPDSPIDLRWTYNEPDPSRESGHIAAELTLESAFLCSMFGDTLTHAFAPWQEMLNIITFPPDGSPATSPAHLLTRLVKWAAAECPSSELVRCYDACLTAAESPAWADFGYLRMIFRQLALDAHRLPHDWLAGVACRFADPIQQDHRLATLARQAFSTLEDQPSRAPRPADSPRPYPPRGLRSADVRNLES
jgi:CheY-like chemotaxis protein